MIKMRIRPQYVSQRSQATYQKKWNANEAFWREMQRNPGFRAYLVGMATLTQMHSACPTAACTGLYKALAEVGAERLLQVAQHIQEQRDARRRIQHQKDNALASFMPATDRGDGGCGWGWSGLKNCAENVGNATVEMGEWAWENRSTVLAVTGAVVCTTATAGTGVAVCTGITYVAVANATVNTANAARNCGWESATAVAVFEYSAALPGLMAGSRQVVDELGRDVASGWVAVGGAHGSSLAAVGDNQNVGSC